jgi:soluble lytic murein transglycosylase
MYKLFNNKVFLLIILAFISITIGVENLIDASESVADTADYKANYQKDKKQSGAAKTSLALGDPPVNTRHGFLMASDLIDRHQGQAALAELDGLEEAYPLLAGHILLAKGRAYQLEQNYSAAEATWQQVVANYPKSAVTGEALYLLGKSQPEYWQQAIAQFPAHPRTQEIIRQQLSQNPNQPKLMAILVKYTPDAPGVDQMRDRLVKEYAPQLTPGEWEAIGDSYWLKWDYGNAAQAYAKAPDSSQNLYRGGRGYHLTSDRATAKKYYLKLIQQYPQSTDTGWGLLRMASLVSPKEGLTYLDQAIAKFPAQAPQALVEKAQYLKALHSPKAATEALQTLLTQHQHSEAAAEYRWQVASAKAQSGDLVSAWQWAQPIVVNNPDSKLAPKAGFWIAKWATKLKRPQDATVAYKSVLTRFPRSYYAWRSAVALGWDVGDFTTLRQQVPQVLKTEKITPPGGSATFQELYKLGLEQEAWTQFQSEISDREVEARPKGLAPNVASREAILLGEPHRQELTLADDFTKGLLQLHQGNNLRGINQIGELQDRDTPQDKQQWQQLRQTPEYWQALYPFPFESTIVKWSKQRQLNPLLVTSLIRQESRFEPEIESSAGAIGLMQVIPPTAKTAAKNIGLSSYSMTNPEDNINIGTYYLDFTHKKYNNNSMLAVASYNAGPNAVAKWVKRYGLQDADEFVAKIPYQETQGYVESVFENYWNYMLIYNPEVGELFKDKLRAKS